MESLTAISELRVSGSSAYASGRVADSQGDATRKVLIIASVTVVLGTFAAAVPLLLLKGDDRRLSREDQCICDANEVAYDAIVKQEGDAAVLDGVRTAVQEHSQSRDLSHASPVLRAGALVALDSGAGANGVVANRPAVG